MPRGTVFFTGNAPVESGRSRSSGQSSGGGGGAASSAATGKKKVTTKMEGKHEASDEMIVGELDEAIGGGSSGDAGVFSNNRANDGDFTAARSASMLDEDAAAASNLSFSIPDTYDSDSSEDERRGRQRMSATQMSMLQPSCLPFPEARLPVGIGSAQVRPSLYHRKSDDLVPGAVASSPFADVRTNAALGKEEQQTWFLFQFPTRLPFDNAPVPPPVVSSDDVAMSEGNPNNNAMSASDVSIPTILPNAFDNSMGTRAGKLGKISIYKSGKTVLDMGGTKFIVSEGLPCGFAQHAVVIDVPNATYVPLGSVGKTVVVTPNVVAAFAE